MISCLLEFLWILFIFVEVTKSQNLGINYESTYNKRFHFFYYPDKFYYLKLALNDRITFNDNNFYILSNESSENITLYSNNGSTKSFSINKLSFDVSTKNKTFIFNFTDNSIFNISLNDKIKMTISEFNNNDDNMLTNVYRSDPFSLESATIEEGLFLMQYGLEATKNFNFITMLIVISGVFISYYGKNWQKSTICLYIIYALYILVEEIYEVSGFVNDTSAICMFLVIFAIIIGGGLGIFLVKKLNNHLKFFIGFAFGYSLSKTILYLFILPYATYTMMFNYIYLFISLLLSVTIGIISHHIKVKNSEVFIIIASSCTGSYILMSGLSFYLGGLIFSKIVMTFYQISDNEGIEFLLKSNHNIFYLVFYIINFILSILFQLLNKTYEMSKIKFSDEVKDQELSATITDKPRLSNETERPNLTHNSGPISLVPHDNIEVSRGVDPNYISNDVYQNENIEEGYDNDENKE